MKSQGLKEETEVEAVNVAEYSRGGFGRGRGGRDDRGAGGDGGPPGGNKYNCQGFGHFARECECTEQKRERPPRDFNNNEDRAVAPTREEGTMKVEISTTEIMGEVVLQKAAQEVGATSRAK